MSYEIESLKRVRYSIEPAGSYAQNRTSNLANFFDIKVSEATMEINTEMLENATMMQRLDKYMSKIVSRRRCNMSLTSYLNGKGTAVTGTGTITVGDNPNVDILTAVMGGQSGINGAGATAYSSGKYTVDSPVGAPGGVFGIADPNGLIEAMRIDNYNSTTAFTASATFDGFNPASGSVVYGGATCYLTRDPNTSLQFLVEGADADNKFTLMGLQGGFGISIPIGELPTISYNFENGADWASGSLTAGSLEQAVYDDAVPPPFVDGLVWCVQRTSGSATVNQQIRMDVQSIELTPNISYLDVTSEKGVNNIVRKRRNRSVPALSGKMVVYFNDDANNPIGAGEFNWFNILNQTSTYTSEISSKAIALAIQVGKTAGNIVFIYLPKIQVTSVQRVDAGGLAGLEVSFDAMEDDLSAPFVTGNAALDADFEDLARSAFTISFL